MKGFLCFCLVGCLLYGCQSQAVEPALVTVALDNPPTNFDPRIGTDASSERLFQLMFSSLVKKDEQSMVVPDLAERWEIPDPTTYVFYLRDGVTFHDGRRLTARDVVFTFQSILDGSVRTAKAGTYRVIERVEALDHRTIRFKLKERFAPFLWNLSLGGIGVVPEGSAAEFGRNPIGSGPFAFVHYIPDGEILLRANPNFYGTQPRVASLRFKIIPEAVVRALELQKGTVDVALNVLPPDMVEVLRKHPKLRVMQSEGTVYQYVAFNLRDNIFRDVRVRKAIAHAIDRESLVHHLWRSQARLAESVIPPNNWAYQADLIHYKFDPERARALLKEAGQPGLSFTFRTSTDETQRLFASVLQQQLLDVGIRMEIRSNEFATFYADILRGNFQAYSLRWIGGNNDPDIFNLIFHSKMTPPNGANRGFYSNTEVDRLIELARQEVDLDKRRAYYGSIQRIVSEEVPYVSLWYLDNVCVFNGRIEGMKLYPAGEYDFLTELEVNGRR